MGGTQRPCRPFALDRPSAAEVRLLGPSYSLGGVKMSNPTSARARDQGGDREGATRTRGPRRGGCWALGQAPRASLRAHPSLRTERSGPPQPVGAGTKARGAPRTNHRQGGGRARRPERRRTAKVRTGKAPRATRWTRACLTRGQGKSESAPERHARAPVRVVHATYSVSRCPCRPWPTA